MAVKTPLRTQEEVQKHFCPKLKDQSAIYRKAQTAYIRRAKLGEVIVTELNGKIETSNTVKDNTSWIVCAKTSFGEQYILTSDNFNSSYDMKSAKPINIKTDDEHYLRKLNDEGFQEYSSKRSVYAHEVDTNDIAWLTNQIINEEEEEGEESCDSSSCNSNISYDNNEEVEEQAAYFIAPWGESMRVEPGDVLVMQYVDDETDDANNEVYRIEKAAFSQTYREKSQ